MRINYRLKGEKEFMESSLADKLRDKIHLILNVLNNLDTFFNKKGYKDPLYGLVSMVVAQARDAANWIDEAIYTIANQADKIADLEYQVKSYASEIAALKKKMAAANYKPSDEDRQRFHRCYKAKCGITSIAELPQAATEVILGLIAGDDIIPAIKELRWQANLGLKEAKDIVEAYRDRTVA